MTGLQRRYLLDVTRLISRSWTGRQSTGIDRVNCAYLAHFAPQAQAVVQHRGIFRILDEDRSDRLFDLLSGASGNFRRKMVAFGAHALATAASRMNCENAVYLNVSHTDFDLASHRRWIRSCNLRPVYLLHDLIPILHSQFCRVHAVRRHRKRVISALQNAAGIIVNSESTARDLRAFAEQEAYAVPPVKAAHLASSSSLAEIERDGRPEPYFICVGTLEKRKNHILLLNIWSRLISRMGKSTPRLIIVGQPGNNSATIASMLQKNLQLKECVTHIQDCPDDQMIGLIAGARALLMPSFAEGFGIPLIEALNLGTPVIASNLASFFEVGQCIPTLLHPADIILWEETIAGFCYGSKERQRQLDMMKSYRRTTWNEHFLAVEAWLDGLPSRDRATQIELKYSDRNIIIASNEVSHFSKMATK